MSISSVTKKTKLKTEFGDFQTPRSLARDVCELLIGRGIRPLSVLEPNCGKGAFILACLESFAGVKKIIGADINAQHIADLQSHMGNPPRSTEIRVWCSDFYKTDWTAVLSELTEPILVIGNPPWVTNAGLSVIGGSNVPEKHNFQNHAGVDAITGKGNFDVSEWMLMRELEWLDGRRATLAMLCKTSVARKILCHAWKHCMRVSRCDIYRIDAMSDFGAAVDACLLVCDFSPSVRTTECSLHNSLREEIASGSFGFRDGRPVMDVCKYERWKFLAGQGRHKWRSGIKHDCAEIMELRMDGSLYLNGLGERVELEEGNVYPMLKGSQLANGWTAGPQRFMLVTQRFVGEDTGRMRESAPKTWEYLQRHAKRFARRASSIYEGRSPFSVFGVGRYSFAPWKIAISALYKKLEFRVVPPIAGKPVVFDDTCYFVACRDQAEAELLFRLLNSLPACEFYKSLIFWDAKRPISAEILRHLNLDAVARELGVKLDGGQDAVAMADDLFAWRP